MNLELELKALEEVVENARISLAKFGRTLLDDESIKLWNLIDELQIIQDQSGIDEFGTASGGFASQIGRLGAVLEELALIANAAVDASWAKGAKQYDAVSYLN
jgi:hypothetical protein